MSENRILIAMIHTPQNGSFFDHSQAASAKSVNVHLPHIHLRSRFAGIVGDGNKACLLTLIGLDQPRDVYTNSFNALAEFHHWPKDYEPTKIFWCGWNVLNEGILCLLKSGDMRC